MTETEKALNYYRSAVERKRPHFVPTRIRLPEKVRSDIPMFSEDGRGYYADAGEHDCQSNQHGALSVKATNGKMLGVKPSEFEVVAWRPNMEVYGAGKASHTILCTCHSCKLARRQKQAWDNETKENR